MAISTEVAGLEIKRTQKDFATRDRAGEDFFLDFDGLPNPDPILRKLNKDIEVYEQVASDTRVRGGTNQRKSIITGKEWKIVPKTIDDAVITPPEQVEILTDILNSYNMRDTISEIVNASAFGYQPFEINWSNVNGFILPVGNPSKGIKGLVGKPARWFRYSKDNELMFRPESGGLQKLPRNKFIVARNNPTFDNPYGEGYLSSCFWPVTFRKNGWSYWSIFNESYGMPFPVAESRPGAKEKERQALADALAKGVQDKNYVVPAGTKIQLLEAAKGNSTVHEGYIDAANTDISIAILGTNLTMEIKSGSLAAAQVSKQVTSEIAEADTAIVENLINTLFTMIYQINFNKIEQPEFKMFVEEEPNNSLATRDSTLQMADPRIKLTEQYYNAAYNFKEGDYTLDEIVQPDPNINTEE